MTDLPKARVRFDEDFAKVSLVLACMILGGLITGIFIRTQEAHQHAPSAMTVGRAQTLAAEQYRCPVQECYEDSTGWQCVHFDKSWSTCMDGVCVHMDKAVAK